MPQATTGLSRQRQTLVPKWTCTDQAKHNSGLAWHGSCPYEILLCFPYPPLFPHLSLNLVQLRLPLLLLLFFLTASFIIIIFHPFEVVYPQDLHRRTWRSIRS